MRASITRLIIPIVALVAAGCSPIHTGSNAVRAPMLQDLFYSNPASAIYLEVTISEGVARGNLLVGAHPRVRLLQPALVVFLGSSGGVSLHIRGTLRSRQVATVYGNVGGKSITLYWPRQGGRSLPIVLHAAVQSQFSRAVDRIESNESMKNAYAEVAVCKRHSQADKLSTPPLWMKERSGCARSIRIERLVGGSVPRSTILTGKSVLHVLIGQEVSLQVQTFGTHAPQYQWSITRSPSGARATDGTYPAAVPEYNVASNHGMPSSAPQWSLESQRLNMYWIRPGNYVVQTIASGRTSQVRVRVVEPKGVVFQARTCRVAIDSRYQVQPWNPESLPALQLGVNDVGYCHDIPGITWWMRVPRRHGARIAMTQLISDHVAVNGHACGSERGWNLDNGFFYGGNQSDPNGPTYPSKPMGSTTNDSPSLGLSLFHGVRVTRRFRAQDYLMYSPGPASVWVPLRLITWRFKATAVRTNGGKWRVLASSDQPPATISSRLPHHLPEWNALITNRQMSRNLGRCVA